MFPSYEAFVQIVSSMADQYAKFIRVARDIPWRGHVASLNYILTSPGWAQEHNGFSHQNPGFIDTVLQKHGSFVHVYFPTDRNSTLVVLEKCLASKEGINLIVSGKADTPEWLNLDQARKMGDMGLAIWDFASDQNPDIVFAAVGDYFTRECLAAIMILKEDVEGIRLRFVNILELTALLPQNGKRFESFNNYFTEDKPVIINFHGYPETIKQILFDMGSAAGRMYIHGYLESGSTTTAFDMQVRNETSRYHLAMQTLDILYKKGELSSDLYQNLKNKYKLILEEHRKYIIENGEDPEFISKWKWRKIY